MQKLINVWAAIAVVGLVVFLAFGIVVWSHGFNSRAKPSSLEDSVAMKLHDSSIPDRYGKMSTPLPAAQIDLVEAGAHYEEHCAVCHADNGSGITKFEGTMYPRPTDLRSEDTQSMSDGELYYTIKNGIRWSGMPAFGRPGDDDEHVWKIVAYVRHLPKLTSSEQQQVLARAQQPMQGGDSAEKLSR
jgi:mono/diheme cytochrome c family protein